MSGYYDDDDRDDRRDRRRDRDRKDRDRDRHKGSRRERPPVYEEEEIIEARRGPARDPRDRGDPRGGALIRRPKDDDSDSAEDIPREFPPGGSYGRRGNDRGPPRRAKSHGGGRYDDYDDRPRKGDRRRKTSMPGNQSHCAKVQ